MTRPPVERASVLLVDDRPENLLALTAVLEPLDVRLVTAGSGEEALRALLNEDFAVVLLDVRMPGMDGYETAEYIRGRERSARTPIIFLTAMSTDMTQVLRGYEAGAVDYVLKPFDPVVLRSKVAVFAELERHRRGRERADELLRRAWESAPTGVVLVDTDGRIVQINPALSALMGAGAAVGTPLAERFHRDDRHTLVGVCQRVLVAGQPDGAELRMLDGDGGELPVAVVPELCRRLHEVLGARGAAVRVVDPGGAVVADAERGSAESAGRALRQALGDGRRAVELDDGTLSVPPRAAGELFGAVAVAGANGA